METRTETNPASEIDALHDQLADGIAASPAADPGLETQPDSPADTAGGESPNKDFCAEILATALRCYAENTRAEFAASLAPVAEQGVPREQIDRIAARAAMSPEMQGAVSLYGSKVLCKYGLARFVNDEAVLITAVIGHFANLRAAKRDRDELLRKFAPANGAQGNPATGAFRPPHETKPE